MISNILVNLLDSNITELTKGTNLFAENGILGKCAYIKTDTYPVGSIVPDVRKTNARVFIKGFENAEAIELGEKMVSFLNNVKGSYVYNDVTYNIKAIDILSTPSILSFENKVVQFKMNVYYVRTSG